MLGWDESKQRFPLTAMLYNIMFGRRSKRRAKHVGLVGLLGKYVRLQSAELLWKLA